VEPLNVPAEHGVQTEAPAARIYIIAAVTIRLHHPHASQTVASPAAEVHTHADVPKLSFIHIHTGRAGVEASTAEYAGGSTCRSNLGDSDQTVEHHRKT
jgi:hypothetical protein